MAQQLSAPFRAAAAAGSRASAAAADPAKVSPSLPFLLCSLSLTFFPTPPPEFSGLFRVGVRLAEGWDVFVRCVTSCVADTAPRFRLKLGFRESGNLGLGGGCKCWGSFLVYVRSPWLLRTIICSFLCWSMEVTFIHTSGESCTQALYCYQQKVLYCYQHS